MMDDFGVIDLVKKTLEIDGQTLPITWWADDDGDPCPIFKSRQIEAGPDFEGMYYHMAIAVQAAAIQ